jgi:hypothetical protein
MEAIEAIVPKPTPPGQKPKKVFRKSWKILQHWPIPLRQRAFELWADSGQSYTLISGALAIPRSQVVLMAKADDWAKRYEKRLVEAREQYDASAAKMLEKATPRMVHGELKVAELHRDLAVRALEGQLRRVRKDGFGMKATEASRIARDHVAIVGGTVGKQRADEARGNQVTGNGNIVFQRGALVIPGLQPLRKLPPASVTPVTEERAPAIEATCSELEPAITEI